MHALGDTHHKHEEGHHHAVGDGIGTHGHIAAIAVELVVHEDDDDASGTLHQEGRDANGDDVLHQLRLQAIDASLQVKQSALVREQPHLPAEGERLRGDGGKGRSSNAPTEPPHKSKNQNDVHANGEECGIHRVAWFAYSPQHSVHAEVHVGDDITCQDHLHKLTGIRQRGVRGAKESQDGIEEHHANKHEQKAHNDVQRHRVAQ